MLLPQNGRLNRKPLRGKSCGWVQRNDVLCLEKCSCTYELTVVMVVHTRTVIAQVRQSLIMEERDSDEYIPPTQELLVIDSYQKIENSLS